MTKGKPFDSRQERGKPDVAAAEGIAATVLDALAGDPERLGRFLSITGLDPATIRAAAAEPGFLPAVMDYVVSDEALLLAVAAETGLRPETLAQAQARLSPEVAWEP